LEVYNAAQDEHSAAVHSSNRVPDAPFKTAWPELALKRMVRMAAEEGKSRISWTPGEAQAARYDLSKTFQSVGAIRRQDGTFMLQGVPEHGGTAVRLGDRVPENKLVDFVGKELAEKIAAQKDNNTKVYEGVDLKVGGEGMKGFYDNMLPKMAEKLGKAYGVKVKKAPGKPDKFEVHKDDTVLSPPGGFKTAKEARDWGEANVKGKGQGSGRPRREPLPSGTSISPKRCETPRFRRASRCSLPACRSRWSRSITTRSRRKIASD
jgi:hypothetical protein